MESIEFKQFDVVAVETMNPISGLLFSREYVLLENTKLNSAKVWDVYGSCYEYKTFDSSFRVVGKMIFKELEG